MDEIKIDLTAIELSQMERIEGIRTKKNHNFSSHAFVSLYLWQKDMDLKIHLDDDFYAVKCGIRDGDSWFFPCGNDDAVIKFISERMENNHFNLCYLRECDVEFLKKNFPGKWKFIREEASDEYIGNIDEYLKMEGSKFSGIRKKTRKIEKNYNVRTERLSDETLDDALNILYSWNESAQNKGIHNVTDDVATELALKEYKELGMDAVIVYIDDVPVSIFGGFILWADTVDVVIGKSKRDTVNGMIYYALREYLKGVPDGIVYCNNEEDLGIEGIRLLKNKLCPIRKNIIWTAELV